jgi:hypothetical protein
MMVAILQENFKVGISRTEDGQEDVFLFDKPLSSDEGYKLSVCMKNLRTAMEEHKQKENF